MDKNKIKRIIGVFFTSMLLYIIISPSAMLEASYSTIIDCIIFQSFTIIVLSKFYKKNKPYQLVLAILFGGFIIDFVIRICYFEYTMLSLPKSVGGVLSIIAGYLVFKWSVEDRKNGKNIS